APPQGMRRAKDAGTQYPPAISWYGDAQQKAAGSSRAAFQEALTKAGYGEITTEIRDAPPFYYAEDYHQQYLAKNPWGYCGIGGTGVSCAAGVAQARRLDGKASADRHVRGRDGRVPRGGARDDVRHHRPRRAASPDAALVPPRREDAPRLDLCQIAEGAQHRAAPAGHAAGRGRPGLPGASRGDARVR